MPESIIRTFVEEKMGKYPQFLIYAVLELAMIIILLMDGLLSFLSNELARFYGLRIQCLFCTRIDHVLVRRSPSFYYKDSICEVHKKCISSLAHSHVHKKLPDSEPGIPEDEDVINGGNQRREDSKTATVPLFAESGDANEDSTKTAIFVKGNRAFGIPLSDSAQFSSRYKVDKKPSIDRPEFFILDQDDINEANDADSETILSRLKRQVHADRKLLIALHEELDEERSASAVAVNNAMAMITRLQAEKAAVQMEALQYRRVMEEQADYDQEALQFMKELLLKREEEMRVLELDLDVYRETYGPMKKLVTEACEMYCEEYRELEYQSLSGEKSDWGSSSELDQNGVDDPLFAQSPELETGNLDESFLDFESERTYLFGLLKELEMMNATPKEASDSSGSSMFKQEERDRGNESKPTLARELSLIRERLRAIEVDNGFLKRAAMILQKGEEGTKLLTEIAQHLRNLRFAANIPREDTEASPFAL